MAVSFLGRHIASLARARRRLTRRSRDLVEPHNRAGKVLVPSACPELGCALHRMHKTQLHCGGPRGHMHALPGRLLQHRSPRASVLPSAALRQPRLRGPPWLTDPCPGHPAAVDKHPPPPPLGPAQRPGRAALPAVKRRGRLAPGPAGAILTRRRPASTGTGCSPPPPPAAPARPPPGSACRARAARRSHCPRAALPPPHARRTRSFRRK